MAEHNIIGQKGEDIAAEIMRKKGYRIMERNWRMGHLETDIIAEKRKEIVFVEVKTRTSTFGGKAPEEAVDILKKRRLVAAANAYIKMHKIEKDLRFDIIGILMDSVTFEVKDTTHLEDAFIPPQKTIGKSSFTGQWRWHHRTKTIR